MKDFNNNAKEVKKKAGELFDTAKVKATSAYYDTKPKAEELADQLNTTASDLYKSGKQSINHIEGYIEEQLSAMTQSIRKQPITSVLIAAGIGYLWAKFKK